MVKICLQCRRPRWFDPWSGRSAGEGNGYPLQYLVWRIPWSEEPSGLQPMGLQRVGHDWATDKHRFEPDLLDVCKYGVIRHIFLKVNCHIIMQAEIDIRTMIWALRKKDSGKEKKGQMFEIVPKWNEQELKVEWRARGWSWLSLWSLPYVSWQSIRKDGVFHFCISLSFFGRLKPEDKPQKFVSRIGIVWF